MKHSQCLYEALDRWHYMGGYLLLGKSTHWIIPHVLHMSHDRRITHFVPPRDLKAPWHSLFGFYGNTVFDDQDRRERMSKTGMFLGMVALFIFGGIWAVKHTLNNIRGKTL